VEEEQPQGEDAEVVELTEEERLALLDAALARATRDVRLVKLVHIALVLVAMGLLLVVAWVRMG
jgi:hypothetical protein